MKPFSAIASSAGSNKVVVPARKRSANFQAYQNQRSYTAASSLEEQKPAFPSSLAQDAGRHVAALLAAVTVAFTTTPVLPAEALLNSPAARVPRTPEAALRRSIPAFNQDVKAIQKELESIQYKLRIPQRKPWGAMSEDLAGAVDLASSDERMLRGILPPDMDTAVAIVAEMRSDLDKVATALALKDSDRTSIRVYNALEHLSSLELLQAPGLPYPLPAQYASLPCLTGRAVVELTFEKANGEKYFISDKSDQGPQSRAVLRLTLDGYTAPLTAGNFVQNVLNGEYDGQRLIVTADSIQAGDQGKDIGALPLEIMPNGDLEPVYRLPVDVRSGEIPVLPLSIYGATAMTHLPGADASVGFVSSRQFFIYKYERQSSGLAGLSFDEGAFGVFGYITSGSDQLYRIENGDTLVSAKVVEGRDKLVSGGGGVQSAE
jgi:cyclophilin family peptidyl-prolyl cis-trans isomerase